MNIEWNNRIAKELRIPNDLVTTFPRAYHKLMHHRSGQPKSYVEFRGSVIPLDEFFDEYTNSLSKELRMLRVRSEMIDVEAPDDETPVMVAVAAILEKTILEDITAFNKLRAGARAD